MRKDRQKAEELRRKGLSYKAIRKKTGVPITTLSDWFKNLDWSIKLKKELAEKSLFSSPEKLKLIARANSERWHKWHIECRKEAEEEYPNLKNDPIFQAGLLLYWGEGDKKIENCIVGLSNVDPEMIKIFYKFLQTKTLVPLEKIFVSLLLYPDLVDPVSKNFWSKATGVSIQQFKKSIYIKGRHPKKRLSYGVCTIYTNSRKIKEKIMKWLELYKRDLINMRD